MTTNERPQGNVPGAVEAGSLGPGPWRWIVTWGQIMRINFDSVVVEAFDAEEAMVIARELHPERPTPRTAFLARQDL
jgi:hypothetical protein